MTAAPLITAITGFLMLL